jgi:hypothetical protein
VQLVEQELLTLAKHLRLTLVFSEGLVVQLHIFTFLVLCCDVYYDLCIKKLHLFCMGLMFYLCYLYSLFILVSHIFFPYQKLFVLLNSNMTGATSGARTTSAYREPDFTHGF